jgi:hypothetical protein
MIDLTKSMLSKIVIHNVGNKNRDELCRYSSSIIEPNEDVRNLLHHYFITPFKSEEYNCLYHESDINLNEVYSFVSKIFEDNNLFYEQSINLSKHLYQQSLHPKIKGGEFYVTYFKGCQIGTKEVDAIGLFKSENKDTFLKVYQVGHNYEVQSDNGININRLDKGCIIFNLEKEDGYIVANIDNINKGAEAKYWTEDFLRIRPRKDEFYYTQNILSLCKKYVKEELPQEFEVSKADQAVLLNKSFSFLQNNEQINLKQFAEDVFSQPEVVNSFEKYKKNYLQERNIQINDTLNISEQALKKKANGSMSSIKLDKNFDINIHGGEQFIVRGYDEERKMYFYQLFFENER